MEYNNAVARSHLRTYLNILGFGRNGNRKYGVSSDKPDVWPDSVSFEDFKGPNYATIKDVNVILESIFQQFNLDIHEHVSISASVSAEEGTSNKENRSSKKGELLHLMTQRWKKMKFLMKMKLLMM